MYKIDNMQNCIVGYTKATTLFLIHESTNPSAPLVDFVYLMTADHLQEVLVQAVGFQPGAMTKPTADLLSALEATAEVLKLKDTSLGR